MLARRGVSLRQAQPFGLRERLGGISRQAGRVQEDFQVPNLAPVVEVDGHGENGLLFLVADELSAEPVDSLRKVEGTHPLDVQFQGLCQGQRLAQPAQQVVRFEIRADEVEMRRSAPTYRVVEQSIDQRRAETRQLRAGMFGQRLWIEGQTQHAGAIASVRITGQENVIDLGLHFVPGAVDRLQIIAEETFQPRRRGQVVRVHDDPQCKTIHPE